jgi:hypothetical protein
VFEKARLFPGACLCKGSSLYYNSYLGINEQCTKNNMKYENWPARATIKYNSENVSVVATVFNSIIRIAIIPGFFVMVYEGLYDQLNDLHHQCLFFEHGHCMFFYYMVSFVAIVFLQIPINVLLKWVLVGKRKNTKPVHKQIQILVDDHYKAYMEWVLLILGGSVINWFILRLYGLRVDRKSKIFLFTCSYIYPSQFDLISIENSFFAGEGGISIEPDTKISLKNAEIGVNAHIFRSIHSKAVVGLGNEYPIDDNYKISIYGRSLFMILFNFGLYSGTAILTYYIMIEWYGHVSFLILSPLLLHAWIVVTTIVCSIIFRNIHNLNMPTNVREQFFYIHAFCEIQSVVLYGGSMLKNAQLRVHGANVDFVSLLHGFISDTILLTIHRTTQDLYSTITGHLYSNGQLKFQENGIKNSHFYGPLHISSLHRPEYRDQTLYPFQHLS